MKKGYIRLLVFEAIIALILFLNSFVWNILSRHFMNIFLLIVLILFRVFFGLEKDRHRYVKDVLMDVFIFLLVSLMLYYLLGIIISFAKVDNYYTFNGIINFIIPTICFIIFKEFLRYNVMNKADGSRLISTISILLFIFIDISTDIYYGQFNSNYNIFIFLALVLLPAISSNLSFSYITKNIGYKPIMLYSLVMSLYVYLLPIIPNPNEYIKSIIDLILPVILCYRLYLFFVKTRDEVVNRDYRKHNYKYTVVFGIIVVILVYFTSGYFKYWAIAVASGSMSPSIDKGDVAIIEKVDNLGKISKGDVLAFTYEKVMIVHRVVNIVKDNNQYYFYTKGDANSDEDKFVVEEDMVVGIVDVRIPVIGYPTVWLNEL